VRFLSDFRELNKRLVRKPFPMPKISTVLHELEGFTYATALDSNMGYYTIRLDPNASRYCTIIFPWGVCVCVNSASWGEGSFVIGLAQRCRHVPPPLKHLTYYHLRIYTTTQMRRTISTYQGCFHAKKDIAYSMDTGPHACCLRAVATQPFSPVNPDSLRSPRPSTRSISSSYPH